jgi:hypothetical protein
MNDDKTTRLDPAALLDETTPGEWETRLSGAAGNERTVYAGARRIATVPHPDRVEPCEENDANARLLAAAPRLARELVEARRAIGYITAQAAREADRSDRLEADVSVLRWQIADLERECERLRREWAAARERITTVESAT